MLHQKQLPRLKFGVVGEQTTMKWKTIFRALKTTGILCSPIAEVDITAMGYVDGKLHIQVKYEDSLETDNHGYIYFKNDKGEEIHCIANIAFSTDSEHQERYVEYVYDLSDVDLTQYKVYGYFVTSDIHIEGNWSVTFPFRKHKSISFRSYRYKYKPNNSMRAAFFTQKRLLFSML